jgi:hypothetical protein
MVRYSALLGLLQKWNKEAAQLEVKAERADGMERSYLLTTGERSGAVNATYLPFCSICLI